MASKEVFLELLCSIINIDEEQRRRRRSHIAKTLFLLKRRKAALTKLLILAGGGNVNITACLAWMSTWPRIPRWWVRPRERSNWWSTEVLQNWDNEMWISNFRMPKETLFVLAGILKPEIQRRESNFRSPISVKQRVAMTIWWLSSPLMYRKVASRFEIGRSTAAEIAIEVCLAMEKLLLRKTVQLGNYHKIMDGFQKLGFPHCIGAIDGTHVTVCPPLGRREEYINRKQGFSVVLQGTTDHMGRFIDVEIGNSGRSHDGHIFTSSALCQAMDASRFIPGNPTLHVDNIDIPPLIIADGAYPIRKWLMTPYRGMLNPGQIVFNNTLCRARNVVERSFSRLKSRWGCLSSRLTVKEENFIPVISTCVILHNICETNGEVLKPDVKPPPRIILPPFPDGNAAGVPNHKQQGQAVRCVLSRMILDL